MSSKSMSGMLAANHGAIGLRSKCRIALSRYLVIQSGSPFHHEMSRTVCSFRPFSGRKTYSSTSLHPSLYRPRSRSVVAMRSLLPTAARRTGVMRKGFSFRDNFPYGDSNNQPYRDHPGCGTVAAGVASVTFTLRLANMGEHADQIDG